MLVISDLTFRIGGRTLIEKASVTVPDGAKVGLVGRNGTGKTTLFNLICGELAYESGSIEMSRGARVGRVAGCCGVDAIPATASELPSRCNKCDGKP